MNGLNRKVSTSLALAVIVVISLIVGIVVIWKAERVIREIEERALQTRMQEDRLFQEMKGYEVL